MPGLTVPQAIQLALTHHQAGRFAEAENIYRQVLTVQPQNPDALHFYGVLIHQAGRSDLALDFIRRSIVLAPGNPSAHSNLGDALQNLGRLDEAVAEFRTALRLDPNHADACSNLGNTLNAMDDFAGAEAACRAAIRLNPRHSHAYNNLANALSNLHRMDEAVAAYAEAIRLDPDFADPQSNMGIAMVDLWRVDEAIECFRRAASLPQCSAAIHGVLLLLLNSRADVDAASILDEHLHWSQRHTGPPRQFIQPHANDRDPERRLRVGYVSPDFHAHPVPFFLLDLFAGHDAARFEVFAYASVSKPDAVTDHLRALVPNWRDIFKVPDERAAAIIRQDRVDILVDLSGHTTNNRLLLFGHKPAPVQVTWLGYANTTGMAAMDWKMTDALADPPGMTEALYAEKLVRLPRSAWCYRPLVNAPPPAPPPAEQAGHVTFGCFNVLTKINARTLKLWAGILRAVPGSRLLLKSRLLSDPVVQQRIRDALAQLGIAPDRVELAGPIELTAEHLAAYSRMDIALDTFPYHGTTTTCDALWMGVPVVTLAGKTHASRVGISLLTNVGVPELIADTEEACERIAIALANDLPRLASLRVSLREKMKASPLMDAAGHVRGIEAAYREMWRAWCAGR